MSSRYSVFDKEQKIFLIMEGWGGGGTETYVDGLIKVLSRKKGVRIELILLSKKTESKQQLPSSVHVRYTSLISLYGIFRRERPDAVNFHLYTSLMPAVLAARALNIVCITTLHMPTSSWCYRHRVYWKIACLLSNCIVCVSNSIAKDIGVLNKNIYTISGGVGEDFFSVVRSCTCPNTFNIAAVGRLTCEKNWSTLVKAISCLKEKQGIIIHFYGSGHLKEELQALSYELDVNSVFHGYVTKQELVEKLSFIHLSVLPSIYEGLGLSALESMAAGIPTITADFPASYEYITNNVTGNIFPSDDYKQLSLLIKWHFYNPKLSSDMGGVARQKVKLMYADNVVYRKYVKLLDNMISQNF